MFVEVLKVALNNAIERKMSKMNKAKVISKQNGVNDEFYTPIHAISPLTPFLKRFNKVLCPFDTELSNVVKVIKLNGCDVKSSSLYDGKDFFKIGKEDVKDIDCIVSNPPYSIKDEVLKHLYYLGKPFCMLMPLTALEGKARGKLYQKYGLELLVFDARINYMKSKKSNWFNTSWFCWNVLPEKLMFHSVIKIEENISQDDIKFYEQLKLFD